MAAAIQGCANWSNRARPAPRKTAASRSTRHVSDSGPKSPLIGPAAASRTGRDCFQKHPRTPTSACPQAGCRSYPSPGRSARIFCASLLLAVSSARATGWRPPTILVALVLVELRLSLDLVDEEIDDADGANRRFALGGLHRRQLPGCLQARLGNPEQRVAMVAVLVAPTQMRDAGEMHS